MTPLLRGAGKFRQMIDLATSEDEAISIVPCPLPCCI
jgi:hypothetical protein